MLAIALVALAQSPCTPRAIVPSSFLPTSTFGEVMEVNGNRLLTTGNGVDTLVEFERDPVTGDWTETQTIAVAGLGAAAVEEIALAGNRAMVRGIVAQPVPLDRDPMTGVWAVGAALSGSPATGDLEIVGDVALVGNSTTGPGVDVYERVGPDRVFSTAIGLAGGGAGESISFDGRAAVIGAPAQNGGVGAVLVYRRESSGGWTLLQTITPNNPRVRRFGADVELGGDVLAISAPENEAAFGNQLALNSGRVQIYRFIPSTATWLDIQTLRDLNGSVGDRLGSTIKLSNGYLIAASKGASAGPNGSLYSFRLNIFTNLFRLERRIDGGSAAFPFSGNTFARSVGITGPLLLAGVLGPNQIGVAPIGMIDCDADQVVDSCEILLGQEFDTNRNGLPDPCEETGVRYCSPATPNSTGVPARMAFFGAPRTALLSVDIYAEGLPSGSLGYFIASQSNQIRANPGMWLGNLCVDGSAISRRVGGASVAGGAGRVEVRYNRSLLPNPNGPGLIPILPGSTWYFQYWYRDNGTTPNANFSDAVQVDFTLF